MKTKEIPCLGCNESGWVFYCQGWTPGTYNAPPECIEAEGKRPFCDGKGKLVKDESEPDLFREMAEALEAMPRDPVARSRALQEWEERAAKILEDEWENEALEAMEHRWAKEEDELQRRKRLLRRNLEKLVRGWCDAGV